MHIDYVAGKCLADVEGHVIGCHSSQETRAIQRKKRGFNVRWVMGRATSGGAYLEGGEGEPRERAHGGGDVEEGVQRHRQVLQRRVRRHVHPVAVN